jgi:hypothetical protein
VVPKGGVTINLNAMLNGSKYTAVDAGTSSLGNQPVSVIKLLPLDEEGEIVLSTLYIDTKNSLVRKAVSTTKENGSYTVEFLYGKFINWGLPEN